MSALPPVVSLVSLDTIVVTGKDRRTWLNGLVTCDLAKLDRGAYGFAVSKVGRVLTDVVVLPEGDRLLVGVGPRLAAGLVDELDKFLVMEDAEVRDATSEHAWLVAHGDVPGLFTLGVGASAPLALGPDGGGAACVPRGDGESLARALDAVSPEAFRAARVLRGVPTFGVDYDDKTYPQETSIDRRAVSFTKGCYLGQEVVCRLEMRGHVHRKLVQLALEGAPPPRGTSVRHADADVGQITSSAPGADGALALAMVKHAQTTEGTELEVDGRRAVVHALA